VKHVRLASRHPRRSLLVRQPLARDTPQPFNGPCAVVVAVLDPVGVAEVELCQIAVQVLLLAVLVHAFHAPLEYGEEALDGVGVKLATGELKVLVVDGLVVGEALAKATVVAGFVRHQASAGR